jgi:serine/threonine protein phosphatase PrpC
VELTFGARTDVGCKRDQNEDALLAEPPIFAVADGMGGHAAGEVASALALQSLSTLSGRVDLQPEDVQKALGEANAAIVEHESRVVETRGMGTTATGICLGTVAGSPHWYVFNIGDSRVYRFFDNVLLQLTVDHSEVAELVAAQRITEEQAANHPSRNIVTRSLGLMPAPSADIWVLPATPGERFLICSDGLPLEVAVEVIARHLADGSSAQAAADKLVAAAIEAGGRDNVTVVVVDVGFETEEVDDTTAPRKLLDGGA